MQIYEKNDNKWIVCHNKDYVFRNMSYKASKYLLTHEIEKCEQRDLNKQTEQFTNSLTLNDFIKCFNAECKENLTECTVRAMKHAIEASPF